MTIKLKKKLLINLDNNTCLIHFTKWIIINRNIPKLINSNNWLNNKELKKIECT